MSSWTTSPKAGGEIAAGAVLEEVPELDNVPDRDAEFYDAVATVELEETDKLRLSVERPPRDGDRLEIKSAMVRVTETQQRGRFNLRREQHRRLVEDGAYYLFAVCEPTPSRDVLAMSVRAADQVEELLPSWRAPEGRAEYTQLCWTNVLDVEEVEP